MIETLPQRAKVRFAGGHWLDVADGAAVFALPNKVHAARCEECRADVEAALAAHFGQPVPVRVVVDGDTPDPYAPPSLPSTSGSTNGGGVDDSEEAIDPSELTNAEGTATSGLDRIAAVFPGAEIVPDEPR